jgi:Na+/phosphate symporter
MTNERKLMFQIHQKDKQIADLYALIDTLQTNLRTATNYLQEEDKDKVVNVQSYKWCMNWRQGDELN